MTFETTHSAFDIIPRLARAATAELPAAARDRLYGLDSRNIRSRPFNLLRTRLLKIGRKYDWRLFGITSPAPGAGKSFIASNLAAALARTPEVEVYLFDLDLRRSTLAANFGIEGEVGIDRFLAGRLPDLQTITRQIDDERLLLVPSFPNQASSAELVAGRPMKRLVDAMRHLPDNAICLCDLPPVFANDDAAVVTAQLDAFLLVIEEGVTTKQQVRDALNLLAPAPCAGTILNRYKNGLVADSYGYGRSESASYGTYYGDYS